ncbi:ArsR/SmtB family transcription factor [Streptomyces sp. NRRL S-118]|uniref:ArsR/SmtB family transcription factor n=1 Tax=Streptomyces sp. NRRL S-118 TaxID=1463881 RepID=UPI0004C8FF92|nr:helix-turn-helix domain-containing protein [Streptomyces sp. NRRL S-118]
MSGHVLHLGPPDRLGVQVRTHPGATVFSVLRDALRAAPQGLPARWRAALRSSVPGGAVEVVRPVLFQRDCWMPDPLALVPELTAYGLSEVGARLRAVDPDRVAAEADGHFGGAPPAGWRAVVDAPRGFLDTYASVVDAVVDALGPRWRQAQPLLSRETERVGVAAVTGALDVLLGTLPPPVRYEPGRIRLAHACGVQRLADRPLVLVPLVSGYSAGMYGVDRDDVVWFAYPVPGLGTLAAGSPRGTAGTGRGPLDLVMGPVRAHILRRLPHRPSLGQLGDELSLGPSTLTYHCDQLAAAGLLHRQRRGRQVVLLATERGAALVDVLEE